MFEGLTTFFKKIFKPGQTSEDSSKNMAKERLHLVLMQDRANVSADFLDLMKQEIIEVIKKYIEVDEKEIDVRLTNQSNDDGTNGAPALYANIPILNIKNEAKAEKEKEQEITEKKVVRKEKKKETKKTEKISKNEKIVKSRTDDIVEKEEKIQEENESEELQAVDEVIDMNEDVQTTVETIVIDESASESDESISAEEILVDDNNFEESEGSEKQA